MSESILVVAFPGQGSLSPGIGEPWRGHRVMDAICSLGTDVGGDLPRLLLDAEEDELTSTRNAQLATIAGQAVSAGISALQGDGVTLDEAFTSGNGAQVNLGVAVPPTAGNNVATTTAGINNQVFVDGIANANDSLSTGPTPFNNESLVSAPLSGATTTANATLLTGVFQG